MQPSSTTPSTSRELDHWQVSAAGISALVLTVGVARFAYTPLLPIMRSEAGLSGLAGGWLATSNYLGYFAGLLIASTLSNLNHKFHLYRLGLVVAVLSTAGMGMTQDFRLWGFLRFISGFSSTAGLLLASGLVLNWLIRHNQKPQLGLHFTGVGLVIIVSSLVLAALAGSYSWRFQWITLGLLGAVFFVPAWFWLPAPQSINVRTQVPVPCAPSPRWMYLMIAAYFCAGFGYVVSATFIVAILEKLPMLSGRGTWIWGLVGLAAVPSSFLWDRIAHAVGQVPALILAYGLQTISIAWPAVSDSAWTNMFSAVLYGGTFVGIVSLTLAIIGRHFPANPARAMARMTLSYGVAQIAAPAMAGYIASATGSYRGALVVAALVMGFGVLLLVVLGREDARKMNRAAADAKDFRSNARVTSCPPTSNRDCIGNTIS